jgi:hypothetical protein
MKKEVRNLVKNTDYEVLKYISQFLTIKDMAKQRKVSTTAIYRRIYAILDKGWIRKIGKNYELTDEGINRLNSFIKSSNTIRLHNLAFKVKLINKPTNWDLQRSKIVNLRNLSKRIDLNNNSYEIHSFNNVKIKTTNSSIIFYMPSFYGKTTDECFRNALESLWSLIPRVEALFKVILIKDRKVNIEIISQHYASLQDALAKIYKQEDNKLYVKDENDNLWLICDYSFRVDELETVYVNSAKEDMDTVKDFLNDLRKNPATMTGVLDLIRQVTANQLIYAKNTESHIELYKGLTKEIRGLSKAIKSIKQENQTMKQSLKHQKSLFDY